MSEQPGHEPLTSEQIDALVLARDVGDALVRTNRDGLRAKAATALDANRTYLAITTPTTAQMRAQLERVTRQTNALIRLVVGLLDDVSDT